jgi:hypothetical protein
MRRTDRPTRAKHGQHSPNKMDKPTLDASILPAPSSKFPEGTRNSSEGGGGTPLTKEGNVCAINNENIDQVCLCCV